MFFIHIFTLLTIPKDVQSIFKGEVIWFWLAQTGARERVESCIHSVYPEGNATWMYSKDDCSSALTGMVGNGGADSLTLSTAHSIQSHSHHGPAFRPGVHFTRPHRLEQRSFNRSLPLPNQFNSRAVRKQAREEGVHRKPAERTRPGVLALCQKNDELQPSPPQGQELHLLVDKKEHTAEKCTKHTVNTSMLADVKWEVYSLVTS